MRAQTIAQLAWYYPITQDTMTEAAALADGYSLLPVNRLCNILHYAKSHRDLAFGLHTAEVFAAQDKIRFPAILHGDDLWVWRAYRYIRGGDDPVVSAVYALTLPEYKRQADYLKALLVVDKMTNRHAAEVVGLSEDVVTAYERLVYNIQDRKEDHAFVASVVYPEGRLVEAKDNYVEDTDYGEILLRAGFTKGAETVLYGMGLKANPYMNDNVAEVAQNLDRRFLADGLVLADMGWANTKSHARPIMNARASLIAGKAAGADTAADTMAMYTPAETLSVELESLADFKVQARARAQMGLPPAG